MSLANAVTNAVISYLTLRGAYVWRNSTGALKKDDGRLLRFGKVGAADVLGCLGDGRLIACEIKVGRDRLSDAQRDFKEQVQARGGIYVICRENDWQDVLGAVLDADGSGSAAT